MTREFDRGWPRIASVAVGVPPHRIAQEEALEFFQRSFDMPPTQRDRLKEVFFNADIETRYAAAPIHWYDRAHSFEQKNDLYIDKAVGLLKQVAVDTLAGAGLACSDVDTLVTVSSTGIAVPTLDARLMEELPFRRNVQRLPLFGLGCAGGALGLARRRRLRECPAREPHPLPRRRALHPHVLPQRSDHGEHRRHRPLRRRRGGRGADHGRPGTRHQGLGRAYLARQPRRHGLVRDAKRAGGAVVARHSRYRPSPRCGPSPTNSSLPSVCSSPTSTTSSATPAGPGCWTRSKKPSVSRPAASRCPAGSCATTATCRRPPCSSS